MKLKMTKTNKPPEAVQYFEGEKDDALVDDLWALSVSKILAKNVVETKENGRFELQTVAYPWGMATTLVPAETDTPDWFCVGGRSNTEAKSFPGHKGRPGKVGGSLPRSVSHADLTDDEVNRVQRTVRDLDIEERYRAGISERHFLFRTKANTKLLEYYNIKPNNIDELPKHLYDKLSAYFWMSKGLPVSKSKLEKHMGAADVYELDSFAAAHDDTISSSYVGVGKLKFSLDTTKTERQIIADTVEKYGISDTVLSHISKVYTTPPQYYEELDAQDSHWTHPFTGSTAVGVCVTTSYANTSSVHIHPNRLPDSVAKTFIHEAAHVIHLNVKRDDAVFQKAMKSVYDDFMQDFMKDAHDVRRTYGLRAYSFTQASEMFADMYMTVKYSGIDSTYSHKLKARLPSTIWDVISKY